VRVADAPLEGRDKLPQIPLIKSMMHDPKSHTTTQHNAHEMGGHR
jgi:hypothetical protein